MAAETTLGTDASDAVASGTGTCPGAGFSAVCVSSAGTAVVLGAARAANCSGARVGSGTGASVVVELGAG